MTLLEKAVRMAVAAHTGQTRKGDATPYVVHPVTVALMLAQHGFSETVVAAALVHDVVEDTSVTDAQVREALGDGVADLVREVSEDKSLPWKERKERYMESVRNGSEGAKAISTADKINNLTGLLDMHERLGDNLWKVFNADKQKKLWFEESMLKMLQEAWHHPLIDEYAALVERARTLD